MRFAQYCATGSGSLRSAGGDPVHEGLDTFRAFFDRRCKAELVQTFEGAYVDRRPVRLRDDLRWPRVALSGCEHGNRRVAGVDERLVHNQRFKELKVDEVVDWVTTRTATCCCSRPNTTPSRFAACVSRSRRARRLAGDDS